MTNYAEDHGFSLVSLAHVLLIPLSEQLQLFPQNANATAPSRNKNERQDDSI
jgi:hypothetical protein